MESEKVMAIGLALIADELGVDPSELRILRFREVASGSLETYLEETGIPFRRYELGDEK